MGMVCENCGWRENPNGNDGRRCIFSNNKKTWNLDGYNHQICNNYVVDTTLRSHVETLIGIKEIKENRLQDKGEVIIGEIMNFYKEHNPIDSKTDWDELREDAELLAQKYDENNFLMELLKAASKYIERKNQELF